MQLQESRRKTTPANQQVVGGPQPVKRQLIQALLGGKTTFECNIQPPEPDDAVSLVLWYKDKSMVPIYR